MNQSKIITSRPNYTNRVYLNSMLIRSVIKDSDNNTEFSPDHISRPNNTHLKKVLSILPRTRDAFSIMWIKLQAGGLRLKNKGTLKNLFKSKALESKKYWRKVSETRRSTNKSSLMTSLSNNQRMRMKNSSCLKISRYPRFIRSTLACPRWWNRETAVQELTGSIVTCEPNLIIAAAFTNANSTRTQKDTSKRWTSLIILPHYENDTSESFNSSNHL